MAFASGSRIALSYIVEVTHGTTPATPAMQLLRLNGFDINAVKGTLRTEEVRSDRQTASLRHGMKSVEGTLPGEIQLANHDDMIEAALSGTWAAVSNSQNIGITNPDQLVCSSNTLLTDGFRVGDVVDIGGLVVSAQDGLYRVTAAAAGALTLKTLAGAAPALTTEVEGAGPTVDLKGKRVEIGTTLRTFTIERQFLDVVQYQVLRGCAINTMEISIQPDSIPGITYGIIGMDFDDWAGATIASSETAAPTNQAMSPFDGEVWEGGTITSIVTGLDFQLNNSRELEEVVGADSSPDVFEGDAVITGTLTMLFQNATAASKFINETETSLWFRLVDPADTTEFINIVIPRVKFTAGDVSPPRTGPVPLSFPFEAFRDTVSGTSLSIQRSNV